MEYHKDLSSDLFYFKSMLKISQIRIPTYEDSPFEGFPLRKIPHPYFKGSQPRLMTLTENLIIPVITKSESDNCFMLLFIVLKKIKKYVGNWSGIVWSVCFTFDEENCREPAKQQREGKNRTRRKLKLYFLTEILCLLFRYSNQTFFLILIKLMCYLIPLSTLYF